MKTKSSKPKKQRKKLYSRKKHQQIKGVSANLSKSLRKSIGRRSLALRKGDKVKVMRGSKKKKEGKILRINRDKMQAFIEGINRKKSDGTEVLIPFRPSNLQITELEQSDKKRLKQKKKAVKKEEKGK